jgi:hypothetical protein
VGVDCAKELLLFFSELSEAEPGSVAISSFSDRMNFVNSEIFRVKNPNCGPEQRIIVIVPA